MPNIKSAIKRVQLTKQRTLKNASAKSAMRTSIKRFEESLHTNAVEAKPALLKAIRSLDKAASKHLIHKNAASRKKSRLTRRYNKAVG